MDVANSIGCELLLLVGGRPIGVALKGMVVHTSRVG